MRVFLCILAAWILEHDYSFNSAVFPRRYRILNAVDVLHDRDVIALEILKNYNDAC